MPPPAEAQSRRYGGGSFAYRAPGPVYRPGPAVRPYWGGYRPHYRSYPSWGWAPFGLGLGLGLAWGWPYWWPPPAAYPYPYPYYGAEPYPPAYYGAPGKPWEQGAPMTPWAGPPSQAATAGQCRVGPVTCDLPVPLEPGTACSCPGGRSGEIWGRAQ